jgi:hypothetical protein
MKNEMKYFKLAVIWLAFISTVSLFGEYIISREVNGFLQLLSFVGLVGVLMYVGNETIKLFKKEEKND